MFGSKQHRAAESESGIKICLNCGDRLFPSVKKCPTCGTNTESSPVINRNETAHIAEIIKSVPSPKNLMTPGWKKPITGLRTVQNTTAAQPKPLTKHERIKENHKKGVACCPKCGSTSISANKKGFGVGKAAVGVLAVGVLGAAAGGIGSNKTIVTCLNCGHKFSPGHK